MELTMDAKEVVSEVSALVARCVMAEQAGAPHVAARQFARMGEHLAIEDARRVLKDEYTFWKIKREYVGAHVPREKIIEVDEGTQVPEA